MKKEIFIVIITALIVVMFTILFDTSVPIANIRQGNIKWNTFNAKGLPKAQGYELVIKYPSYWTPQEGNRPHIVKKFTTTEDNMLIGCMLLVHKLPYRISPKENEEMVAEMTKEDIPLNDSYPDSKILDFNKTRYEAIPGVFYKMEIKEERANRKMKGLSDAHLLMYEDIAIQMQCLVLGHEGISTMNDIEKKYNQNKRLFDLFANSLVIIDKYKEGESYEKKGK